MKELKMLKEKGKIDGIKENNESGLQAAMKIQTMWRGFATRKKTRRRKMEEMILIGMVPPPPPSSNNCSTEIDNAELVNTLFFFCFKSLVNVDLFLDHTNALSLPNGLSTKL